MIPLQHNGQIVLFNPSKALPSSQEQLAVFPESRALSKVLMNAGFFLLNTQGNHVGRAGSTI